MRRHAAALVLALALAASPAPPAWGAALPPGPDVVWRRFDTPRLYAYSDADSTAVLDVLRRLDRLQVVIERTTAGLSLPPSSRSRLLLLRNTSEFNAYAAIAPASLRQVAGRFVVGGGESCVFVDMSANLEAAETAQHEFIHLLLHRALPRVPVWLDEGLAEYFRTLRTRGSEAEVGWPVRDHLSVLSRQELLPVARLVAVTAASPEYTTSGPSSRVYAGSWLLVHMLLEEPDSTTGDFDGYLRRLRGGEPPVEAFRAAFPGLDSGELDRRLAGYARRAGYSYRRIRFDEDLGRARIRVAVVRRAEILDVLAETLRWEGTAARAGLRAHWEEALRAEPGHAPSMAGLGRLAESEHDAERADAWYRRALDADSTDADVLTRVAAGLLERAWEQAGIFRRSGPGATGSGARARALLERALVIAPADARAQVLYGVACVGKPDLTAAGIDALLRAMAIQPYDPQAIQALVCLHAQGGATTLARRIARRQYLPVASREALDRLTRFIAEQDVQRALALTTTGRFVAADSLLAAVIPECDVEAERALLRDIRVDLRLNYATELSSTLRAREARAWLGGLPLDDLDDAQRERVRSSLAGLDDEIVRLDSLNRRRR